MQIQIILNHMINVNNNKNKMCFVINIIIRRIVDIVIQILVVVIEMIIR